MKKVLCVGATPDEEQRLRAFCQENQWPMSVTDRLGRKKGEYPVQFVLHALRGGSSVAAVAEETGISRRSVYRIREEAEQSTEKG